MSSKNKDIVSGLLWGLGLALLVFFLNPQGQGGLARRVCDGCFVAATLVLGFGGLLWARNKGAFDFFSYSLSNIFRLHLPVEKKAFEENFVDYKSRKQKERKPSSGFLIAGAVWLGLSFLALGAYYMNL